MQLSIKTPPELTLPLLEKCAVLGERFPSHFVTDMVWQCLKSMDTDGPFHPLYLVEKYYRAWGKEAELLLRKEKDQDALMQRLMEQDRKKRAAQAAKRQEEFKASLKKKRPPKHLHLKISQGMGELPQRIKAKADWLRLTPNAFVVACLRGGLEAMDDPMKAVVQPPIVKQFRAASFAELRRKATDAIDAMVLETIESMLRKRSGPVFDTIVRFALCEKWDVTLREILRDADALSNEWMPKD